MSKRNWNTGYRGSTLTVQQKMLAVLSDGLPHTRRELFACLYDTSPDTRLANIQQHISHLRKQLRPQGLGIVCELVSRRICYRQVRFISAD